MNHIAIIGRLGRDPELRQTKSGMSVCNLSVAVSERRGGEERVTWFRVTAWDKTADFVAKYFTKGRSIAIEGSMTSDKYTGKDGVEKDQWTLNANRVHFVGDKPKDDAAPQRGAELPADADLPF